MFCSMLFVLAPGGVGGGCCSGFAARIIRLFFSPHVRWCRTCSVPVASYKTPGVSPAAPCHVGTSLAHRPPVQRNLCAYVHRVVKFGEFQCLLIPPPTAADDDDDHARLADDTTTSADRPIDRSQVVNVHIPQNLSALRRLIRERQAVLENLGRGLAEKGVRGEEQYHYTGGWMGRWMRGRARP